jgi:hypothetical protein
MIILTLEEINMVDGAGICTCKNGKSIICPNIQSCIGFCQYNGGAVDFKNGVLDYK